MSAQHHSPAEIEAQQRMLQEFLGNAKPRFPDGKISPDDEGELSFAIAADHSKQVVVLRFSKGVDWLGLDKSSALNMAELLIKHAYSLSDSPTTKNS